MEWPSAAVSARDEAVRGRQAVMCEGNSSQGLTMSKTTDVKVAQAKLGKGKPTLRGVSHVIAACVALSAGIPCFCISILCKAERLPRGSKLH